MALTPFMSSQPGLMFTLGLLTAAGAGAGSFSILVGATASRLAPEKRSFAAGFINAGGSLGQLVFAPLGQLVITAAGWGVAMFGLAAASLLTLPLAWPLRGKPAAASNTSIPIITAAPVEMTLREQLQLASRDRRYWLLHLGLVTCGFHIAFLVTHLPGEIALCGLQPSVAGASIALIGRFNVLGSLVAGALGQRHRMKMILAIMYASRAVMIVIYLMSPPTTITFYIFAAALGFTWLATVAPTAGLIGKLLGPRYLGTLFGLTLLSHQIDGFFGAWLGGVAMECLGDYTWMWYAVVALALIAAMANLPIREKSPRLLPVGAR
ncbi:MAG: MFS transporter [Pseudoxanthomonas sp.]